MNQFQTLKIKMEEKILVKNKNMVIATIVIIVSAGALLLLLTSSSIPIFSVKEVMNHSNPESLIERKIQIVGIVNESNDTFFSINDPEEVNNTNLIIYVNSTNIEKPVGFELGKAVLVEGKLISIDNQWIFSASMISTKCPSKYES